MLNKQISQTILKTILFLTFCFLSSCAANKEIVPDAPKKQYPVLTQKANPVELTQVNKLIDGLSKGYEKSDQQYVKELNKTNWGDIFAVGALNKSGKLAQYNQANKKAVTITEKAFKRRADVRDKFLKDLTKLEKKSELAAEVKKEYVKRVNENETGFEALDRGMLNSSKTKFESINTQLDVLKKLKGKYKQLDDGRMAFNEDADKTLVESYLNALTKHNQATALQKTLAESLIKQFDELQVFVIETTK